MSLGVIIAAGGTAGHVYPGLALAGALREARPDVRVAFVGTQRGIETTAVPAAGHRLHTVDVLPWSPGLGARHALVPVALARAVAQCRRILRTERTGVVAGMGGYASLPAVIAARLGRLPSVIHEQNAIAGIANVVSARLTRNVALGFAAARAGFPAGADVRVVGNPVRAAIATVDRAAARAESRTALGLAPAVPAVVIFGGSLGAARLNEAARGIAEAWHGRDDRQLLLVAGRLHEDAVRATMPPGPVTVTGFVERMELAYAAADVVVCRAGALTVAEVAAAGVPAVFVPYPHARRDHQAANARALADAGGAVVVGDGEATAGRIGGLLDELLGDAERLASMSRAAQGFARPDAARDLAAWVLAVAEASR